MTGHLCARESRMTCPPPVPGVRAERGSQWSGASVFRDEAGMPAAAASHLGAVFWYEQLDFVMLINSDRPRVGSFKGLRPLRRRWDSNSSPLIEMIDVEPLYHIYGGSHLGALAAPIFSLFFSLHSSYLSPAQHLPSTRPTQLQHDRSIAQPQLGRKPPRAS